MLLDEVLISELGSVDRLSTGAVSGGEIASLTHEVRDHTVEGRSLVVKWLAAATGSLLAGAESAEVLGGSWSGVSEKLHHYAAGGGATDGHVEENLRVRHCCRGELKQ